MSTATSGDTVRARRCVGSKWKQALAIRRIRHPTEDPATPRPVKQQREEKMLMEVTTVTKAVLSMSHAGTRGLPAAPSGSHFTGREGAVLTHLCTCPPCSLCYTSSPLPAFPRPPLVLRSLSLTGHSGGGVISSSHVPPALHVGALHPVATPLLHPFLPWHLSSALIVFQSLPVCPPLLGQSDLRCWSHHTAPHRPRPVVLQISAEMRRSPGACHPPSAQAS